MKNRKIIPAALVLLTMILALWGCSAPAAEAPEAEASGYTVTVLDESGTPVAGAMIQLCSNVCVPGVTDAEGIARFDLAEDSYKVAFIALPEGYAYMDDVQEFAFAEGSRTLTITLKHV